MGWKKQHSEYLKSLRAVGFTQEGWIDRDGGFWPVEYFETHEDVAAMVLDCEDTKAAEIVDRCGWLRISDYGDRTAAKALNQKQVNTLFDYCTALEFDFKSVNSGIMYL